MIGPLLRINVKTLTLVARLDLSWHSLFKHLNEIFRDKSKVNFHIFGCSDGTEAFYSAKLLMDKLGKEAEKFLPVKASDIDEEVIRAAKSGRLKLTENDLYDFIEGKDVFRSKNIFIKNDVFYKKFGIERKTFDVNSDLKNAVDFKCCALTDVLKQIEDNSNTVIMCRNVSPYLLPKELEELISTVSKKLKSRSLFVVGDCESNEAFINIRLREGFREIMDNVWQKQ